MVRIGVWVKVRVSFRVGGQPDNCSQETLPPGRVRVSFRVGKQPDNYPQDCCPRLGLGFGVGLVLWFGGQFSSGAIVLEPQKSWKMRVNKFIFRTFNVTKNDFFVAIFQGFYLNISDDLLYRTPPCK